MHCVLQYRSAYSFSLDSVWWAFGYNLLTVPVAAGLLYPFLSFYVPPAAAGSLARACVAVHPRHLHVPCRSCAGLSEILSSVPVVVFSLLLGRFRARPREGAVKI